MYQTKSDFAYTTLKNEIISGNIPMGSKLTLAKCMKDYGLSSMPVREAFRRLEQDGFVTRSPNSGVKVISYTLPEHLSIMLNRISIQSLSIRLASQYLSQEDLEQLDLVIRQMESAANAHNSRRYSKLLNAFYHRINHCTPFKEMELLIDKYFEKSRLYNSFIHLPTNRERLPVLELQELVDAFKKRDSQLCASIYHKIQLADFKNLKENLLQNAANFDRLFPKNFFLDSQSHPIGESELMDYLNLYETARECIL